MPEPLLSVRHLSVDYLVGAGRFHALRDASFDVPRGTVVGIVGETGCGKSTLAHAIPRLLPEPPAIVVGGEVWFRGVDLLALPRWRMPAIRGTGISMVFQEPINSLNPAFRIVDQIREAIRVRRLREAGRGAVFRYGDDGFDYAQGPPSPRATEMLTRPIRPGGGGPSAGPDLAPAPALSRAALEAEVLEMLRLVRINDPETILDRFPHELSGGMRQRVMIAIALSGRPSLLIADEPTSALDLTIQAQVLTLMKELLRDLGTSILFISHDLGVVAEMVDQLGVMYAGELVEFGPVGEVFDAPHHPYTKALIRAFPDRYKDEGPLPALAGSVPNLSRLPPGCSFAPRCSYAQSICRADPGPVLGPHPEAVGTPEHRAACHFATEVAGHR